MFGWSYLILVMSHSSVDGPRVCVAALALRRVMSLWMAPTFTWKASKVSIALVIRAAAHREVLTLWSLWRVVRFAVHEYYRKHGPPMLLYRY